MNKGLIHLYSGDGKGKTTAAIGLMVRALGRGKRCILLQFLKGSATGELLALQSFDNLRVLRGKPDTPFTFLMTEEEKLTTKALHDAQLAEVFEAMQKGEADVVIMDEICAACSTGLLDLSLAEKMLAEKPETVELVLTGRDPQPFMLKYADYHTEMTLKAHPYESMGVGAREGIEY